MKRSNILICPFFRLDISKSKQKEKWFVDCFCTEDPYIFYSTIIPNEVPSEEETKKIKEEVTSICINDCPKIEEFFRTDILKESNWSDEFYNKFPDVDELVDQLFDPAFTVATDYPKRKGDLSERTS